MNKLGEKTKIVHLVHYSSRPGGIEVLLPVIISNMKNWLFQGYVIRKSFNNDPNVYDSTNVLVKYGSQNNLLAIVKLFIYSYKNRDDIFQVYNIGPFFLFAMRLAGAKKIIYSIHGTLYWKNWEQKIIRKVFWWLAINRQKFVFTSNTEFSRKVFLDAVDTKLNIIVLYNPINLKDFCFKDEESNSDTIKKIVYVGRLDNGKGLESWVKCANTIHKEIPEIRFEIYGEGILRIPLQKEIFSYNAEDYIALKGYTKNISEIYKDADLLLFLSEYESFGNVVVESILCGTPVLTTAIPSMREIFRNYPEFLLPLSEPGKIILEKLKSYSRLKKLSIDAAKEFKNRFSSDLHTQLLENIYCQIQLRG